MHMAYHKIKVLANGRNEMTWTDLKLRSHIKTFLTAKQCTAVQNNDTWKVQGIEIFAR